jgi:hypothetical protein
MTLFVIKNSSLYKNWNRCAKRNNHRAFYQPWKFLGGLGLSLSLLDFLSPEIWRVSHLGSLNRSHTVAPRFPFPMDADVSRRWCSLETLGFVARVTTRGVVMRWLLPRLRTGLGDGNEAHRFFHCPIFQQHTRFVRQFPTVHRSALIGAFGSPLGSCSSLPFPRTRAASQHNPV